MLLSDKSTMAGPRFDLPHMVGFKLQLESVIDEFSYNQMKTVAVTLSRTLLYNVNIYYNS